MSHSRRAAVSLALAAAFLDGKWTVKSATKRGAAAVGVKPKKVMPVAERVIAAYQVPPLDRRRELAAFIASFDELGELTKSHKNPRKVVRVIEHRLPVAQASPSAWPVRPLSTALEIGQWLNLLPSDLDWYADARSLERTAAAKLRHYDRHWVYGRSGRVRLLEAPRPNLKAFQRIVLRDIVGLIPPHEAAHGFVPGRSVLTYAAPHVGADAVVHLDLQAFFATVTAGRVYGVFRTAGYPEAVAHCLAGLATTVLPYADRRSAPQALRDEDLDGRHWLLSALSQPHLPQGAPTSPALANLVAYRLDLRLAGLARAADAGYTRYADDLAFSFRGADASRRARRLVDAVGPIVREEGFRINRSKTRVTLASQRQHLCGVVVNERPAVSRRDRDQLRAVLHNCVQRGPMSQNREQRPDFRAHLLGRVAWVESVNPEHGEQLRTLFEQISWPVAAVG
jgi:RNA-directed DNA polymerase